MVLSEIILGGGGIVAQRWNFGKGFKAKIAIEAIKGEKAINEIASTYEVRPNQLSKWKKLAIERLSDAMADKDIWNKKYFQFGSLILPRGQWDNNEIVFSGQAVKKYDNVTCIAEIVEK